MRDRFLLILGAVLAVLYLGLWHWLTPGDSARLSQADVDGYLARMAGRLPTTPAEEAEFLGRLRAWGYADDGRPIYMLNVMSYYDRLKPVPHGEQVTGTPREANHTYEKNITHLLFGLGGYPLFVGTSAREIRADHRSGALVDAATQVADTDDVVVVRYPSRRAFLELISDPAYLPWSPYKMASVQLALLPLSAKLLVPDLRFAVGALFPVVFLACGWWRSARTRR
ncbi:MAG: hypothetical protein U1F09_14605 [Steroidobacteraceae bacterium]